MPNEDINNILADLERRATKLDEKASEQDRKPQAEQNLAVLHGCHIGARELRECAQSIRENVPHI